jgi:hypothetical protein
VSVSPQEIYVTMGGWDHILLSNLLWRPSPLKFLSGYLLSLTPGQVDEDMEGILFTDCHHDSTMNYPAFLSCWELPQSPCRKQQATTQDRSAACSPQMVWWGRTSGKQEKVVHKYQPFVSPYSSGLGSSPGFLLRRSSLILHP